MSENSSEAHKPPKKDPGDVSLGITDPHFSLSEGLTGVVDACIRKNGETVRYLELDHQAPQEIIERIDALNDAGLLISAGQEEQDRYESLASNFADARPDIFVVIPSGAKQLHGERLFRDANIERSTLVSDEEVFEYCGNLWREAHKAVGSFPADGLLKRTAMMAHDFDQHGLKIIPETSEWIDIEKDKIEEYLEESLKKEMLETIHDADMVSYFIDIFLKGFRIGQ